jgi:uncharacterized RDD family membrane protein YckC
MTVVANAPIERSQLGQLAKLGGGGQGDVFHAPNVRFSFSRFVAYKEYHADWRPQVDFGALQSMIDFLSARSPEEGSTLVSHVTWPVRVVADKGVPIGFLMPEVPDEFHVWLRLPSGGRARPLAQFQYLLNPPDIMARRGILLSDRQRYLLLADMARTLDLFERSQIAVGDLSPKNLLFSLAPTPRCFFVDADALRLAGRTVMPQAETPDWDIRAISQEELATVKTDRYKFGLIVLRLLGGDQASRSARTLPAAAPPLIKSMVTSALSRTPNSRPSAATWIAPLESAAAAADAVAAMPRITPDKIIVPVARTQPAPPKWRRPRGFAGATPAPPQPAPMTRTTTPSRWYKPAPAAAPRPAPRIFQAPPCMPPGTLVQWAGPWARMGAHGIDALVLLIISVVLCVLMSVVSGDPNQGGIFAILAFIALGVAMPPVCWTFYGATPGQKAAGVCVVHAPDGRLLTIGESATRLLMILASTVSNANFIGAVRSDPFGRAWHDKQAGSLVVCQV